VLKHKRIEESISHGRTLIGEASQFGTQMLKLGRKFAAAMPERGMITRKEGTADTLQVNSRGAVLDSEAATLRVNFFSANPEKETGWPHQSSLRNDRPLFRRRGGLPVADSRARLSKLC
jgi:hypothetical protein